MNKKLIIAVDGFSSCGKSSFAKAIARKMAYIYIDSGAMYRAITLYAIENNLFPGGVLDEKSLLQAIPGIRITFALNAGHTRYETCLNGKSVEDAIRQIAVSEKVSHIAKLREVRRQMVTLQRDIGKNKGIVMDGRDIGTVVFPGADLKIFMTASLEVRTDRRYRELLSKGEQVSREEVMANLEKRDRIDSSREESPLRQAPDAVLLDNSHMTPEEQLLWLENIMLQKDLL